MEHISLATVWNVVVTDELRVVRYDPEMADMDHPNGEIVETRFYLQATNSHGDRRRIGCFVTEADAECYFWHAAPPVDDWDEDFPEFGSLAYEEYGIDLEMQAERALERCEELGFDLRYANVF